jgi:Tfp pilus assembly major pilin PilA
LVIGIHKKIIAFTLAEILITIGVIGVVSAITLPSVIQNYKEKQTVVRLKRAYSTISNAYNLAKFEHGEDVITNISASTTDGQREVLNTLKPYLEIAKDCTVDTKKNCKPPKREYYYNRVDKTGTDFSMGNPAIVLKDGSLIRVYSDKRIIIDINGMAEPNTYGLDVFSFYFDKYKFTPYYNKYLASCSYKDNVNTSTLNQSLNCAWWILRNNNMDYLHCDLNWDTQTKCGK